MPRIGNANKNGNGSRGNSRSNAKKAATQKKHTPSAYQKKKKVLLETIHDYCLGNANKADAQNALNQVLTESCARKQYKKKGKKKK